MTTHELKTWPAFFERILSGEKTFEVRKDDRGFQCGDDLLLREWDPDHERQLGDGGKFDPPTRYTGREARFRVGFIYRSMPGGLNCGDYVVMSLVDGDRPRGEADSEDAGHPDLIFTPVVRVSPEPSPPVRTRRLLGVDDVEQGSAPLSADDLAAQIFAVIDDAYLAETGQHIARRSWLSIVAGQLAEHAEALLAARNAEIDSWRGSAARLEMQREEMRVLADAAVGLLERLLVHFHDGGHPGSKRRRTGWINESTLAEWTAQVRSWRREIHEPYEVPFDGVHADDCQGCEHIPGAVHCATEEIPEPVSHPGIRFNGCPCPTCRTEVIEDGPERDVPEWERALLERTQKAHLVSFTDGVMGWDCTRCGQDLRINRGECPGEIANGSDGR